MGMRTTSISGNPEVSFERNTGMENYDKAVELAVLTTGLDADAAEVFGLAQEYSRYLDEFPLAMLMAEEADVIEGILVDADMETGEILVSVADPEAEDDDVTVKLAESDFMRETIAKQVTRQVVGEGVKVMVGPETFKSPYVTLRVPSYIYKEFAHKLLWIEKL